MSRPETGAQPRRTQHRRHHDPEKSPWHRQHLRSADHEIQRTLRGFYDVSQLAEVYGIDEERYQALAPWFIADTLHVRRLEVNALPAAALRKHPYLDYRQAKAIEQLRKQKKQALRMGEPATDRRIYRYGQETAHTVPVIQINFKT